MEAGAEIRDHRSSQRRHPWARFDDDADDKHLLVQRVLVTHAGDHRRWCYADCAEQISARSCGAGHRTHRHTLDECGERRHVVAQAFSHEPPADQRVEEPLCCRRRIDVPAV